MAKDLLLPGSILSLHRSAVEKLLKAGNGDAALLYLCLTAGQNSGALPWGPDQVEAAQNTLLRLGLISSDTPVQPPAGKAGGRPAPGLHHPGHRPGLPERRGFKALVPAVEQMLGKVLSPADLKILYTLFDFLVLPPEVILTLTGWCVEQAKQKGPGRKPTLTQIRREAYKWQKAGIDTLEAADAHLHRLSRRNRRGTEILQLLFGESRAPVEKEAEFLDAWIQMGCSDELLLLARDRTIFQLQEFKWTYMNGILTRWYKEGLTTVEAVEASERKNRRPQYPRATPQPAQGAQPLPSDDIGRMIEQARRAAAAKEG
ncbi:MAG: DnaD domain protein [Evtepia gabavorous]